MADIQTIKVNVQTARDSGAGTDGDVYIGFAGREFHVDTTADDFEAGSSRTYVLGKGSNVVDPSVNDPRDPRLRTGLVDGFPVYVRFHPRSRTDNWKLQRAAITFGDDLAPRWDTAEIVSISQGIWLGTRSGLVAHLRLQRAPVA